MSRRPSRILSPARRARHRRPRLEVLEGRALMATFMVTSTADSGPGSLRTAIMGANTDAALGGESIAFNIGSGGSATIHLASPLPAITHGGVVIDGESQPGYVGTPLITLDGSAVAAGSIGLNFTAGSQNIVRGMAVVNFAPNAAGAGGRGIALNDGGSDTVSANYLGIATDGVSAAPNGYGIEVNSASNTIGGLTGAARNLISGNSIDGVYLSGSKATGNIVEGNFIGTDVSGIYTVGNDYGIDIAAPNNIIGGTTSGAANVISGNIGFGGSTGIGILFQGNSPGNTVQGNHIGVGPVGNETQLGNVYGIYFGSPAGVTGENITGETIGGTVAGAGNTISGNFIAITGNVTSGLIAGNKIGVDSAGTTAIPNSEGIFLGAISTTIGGTVAAAANIIAATSGDQPGTLTEPGAGINLTGAADLIQGNYIGTDATGTLPLPNLIGATFHLTGSTIGGTATGAGNVIAGNAGDGLRLDATTGNLVQGNFVGVNRTGVALANQRNGILLNIFAPAGGTPTQALALNDTIGGTAVGAGNVIAHNVRAGVAVSNSYGAITGLGIRGNSIHDNGGLGIDLPYTNLPLPGYLFVTATAVSGSQITVNGVFDGVPGQASQVDLFASAQADPSGFGEGQTYLGTVTVTPGASGLVGFQGQFNAPAGQPVITGTVTGIDGNTQEFSQTYPSISGSPTTDLVLTGSTSGATTTVGATVTYTETITNSGTSDASGVIFRVQLPNTLVNASISSGASGGSGSVGNSNIAQYSLGTIKAGGSVAVTITASASQLGAVAINPGVSSTVFDTNYANNQITQSVTVNPAVSNQADLAITETASPATPTAGTATTFTITVANNGPGIATNVRLNDFLPSGATLVSFTPSQGASPVVNGTLITANLGTILAGTAANIVVVVRPTTPGTVTNAANVSGDQMDPIVANNATSASVRVPARVSLSLAQTFSPTIGVIGQYQIFTVTATNLGPDPATNVTLIDALPTGAAFVFATPSQGGYAALANGVLTNNFGTIAAGVTATLTVVVLPTAYTTLINYAGVYSPDLPSVNPAFAYGAVAVPSGPSVIGVVGSNSNRQLIATFDEPLSTTTAQNKANYRIYALGTSPRAVTAKDKPLAITSAVYLPQTNAVVITPASGLVSTQYYALTIVGSTATGVADTRGRRLINTKGGNPGANFNATFLAGSLPQG